MVSDEYGSQPPPPGLLAGAYADQNERDYRSLAAAAGRITAEHDQ